MEGLELTNHSNFATRLAELKQDFKQLGWDEPKFVTELADNDIIKVTLVTPARNIFTEVPYSEPDALFLAFAGTMELTKLALERIDKLDETERRDELKTRLLEISDTDSRLSTLSYAGWAK